MELQNGQVNEAPPTLSPRGTEQLLLAVLRTDPSQPLNQATLKDLGICQNKHANKLLSYLALRTTTGTLTDDVVECREDPARFADLLRERLTAACVRSGCTEEQLTFLGREPLNQRDLKERLAGLPLIRANMTAATRASVIGCLATLSEVLAARNGVSELALKRRLGMTSNGSTLGPALPSCDGREGAQPRFRRPVFVESREVKREFLLGYVDNKPQRVSVTFDRPLNSDYLERLGNLLIEEAQAMRDAQPVDSRSPADPQSV